MRFSRIKKITRDEFFEEETQREPSFGNARLTVCIGIIALTSALLFTQALYLTISRGSELQEKYTLIHSQKEWVLPPRGLITDKNGELLAVNAPGKKEYEFSRLYPKGPAFSHVLGFIGRVDPYHLSRDESYLPADFVGKAGIEGAYEEYLRGTHGSVEHPVRVEGNIAQAPLVTPPKPGNNLTLTLDAAIQQKLYDIIAAQQAKVKSPGAAAVVLDPNDGAVRALVSSPSFDNNDIAAVPPNDPTRPLFNRAIAGTYPPGSTVKPFLATAALQERIINPKTIIHDKGRIEVRSIYDPNIVWTFRGWKALGNVDMRRAIAFSSNVYFFTLGGGYGNIKGLGITRLKKYYELFGLGTKTGIDLKEEAGGFIPIPDWKKQTLDEEWFIGDTYNTSIGQGFVRVSPLQLAYATVAIANRGTLYKPYLVQNIKNQEGKELFVHIPEVVRQNFVNGGNLEVAREGMRQAVVDGTMWRLKDFPVPVAGKTGTAQAGTGKPHHGWVTIFFPYEKPEIVLTILIENGEGGEQSAVPTAKEFLDWYVKEYRKPAPQ